MGCDFPCLLSPFTLTLALALSHRGRGDVPPLSFGHFPRERGKPCDLLRLTRPSFAPRKGERRLGQGCQFQSWSAKAKVWGRPPEWMKTMGVSGSTLPRRIWSIKPDIDLPV